VGVVHGLESDSGIIAVEVAVLNKVFDGIDNLSCSQLTHSEKKSVNVPSSADWPAQALLLTLGGVSMSLILAVLTFTYS
jgi:hypothetical protein